MIKRLRKYLKTKGLAMNVSRSKIVYMRKVEGRRKKKTFTSKGVKIDEVKLFPYLGYRMKCNNGDEAQIEALEKKGKPVLGRL